MNTIKVQRWSKIPFNFTGIVEWPDGEKLWYKNGNLHKQDGPARECSDGTRIWYKEGKVHRKDGPAKEWRDGHKEWWLEGIYYFQINLNNHVVLDHNKGKYGIMWYKLLDEDNIIEYPDIPGLITK